MLVEQSGPGPPTSPCPCSTCAEEPSHTLQCHFCKVCYFKVEEDAGKYNIIGSADEFDVYDSMPGTLVWLCPTCSHKSIADKPETEADCVPKWFHKYYESINERMSGLDSKLNSDINLLSTNCQNLIEKVNTTNDAINKLLDKGNFDEKIAPTTMLTSPSPLRKKSKTESFVSDNVIKSAASMLHEKHQPSISKWKLPHPTANTPSVNPTLSVQPLPADKFCIKLKRDSSKCDVPITKTLQTLAKAGNLKNYKHDPKGKYAINLLFPDAKQCESAVDELKTSLNDISDINVSSPEIISPKRTYFVGLSEGTSACELRESLFHYALITLFLT